jgi:hypothetical protein
VSRADDVEEDDGARGGAGERPPRRLVVAGARVGERAEERRADPRQRLLSVAVRIDGIEQTTACGSRLAAASVVARPPALCPSSPSRLPSTLPFAGDAYVGSAYERASVSMIVASTASFGDSELGNVGATTTKPQLANCFAHPSCCSALADQPWLATISGKGPAPDGTTRWPPEDPPSLEPRSLVVVESGPCDP